MNEPRVDLQAMLRQAHESRLWGTIQLDFQGGQLVMIRRTETTKIGKENNLHERRQTR